MKPEELKVVVQEKYAQIANQSKDQNETSCCGTASSCCDVDYSIFSDDYSNEKGYTPDADLGLGCGIPTQYADIKEGDSVLDLGSGAGNDAFVARSIVGETGKVTGIDFTDNMLQKANANNVKMGFSNVEFVKGDIEDMPIQSDQYDVVISNCVLNLVPDKQKAYAEIYRVLKKGGHFCISDVVLSGELPEGLKKDAEMYAGCVSGAIHKDAYLEIINNNNFGAVEIMKSKEIVLPDDILLKYISKEQLREYKATETGIFSITVKGKK